MSKKKVCVWDIVFLSCTEVMNLVCRVRSSRFVTWCSVTIGDVCESDINGEEGCVKGIDVIFGWRKDVHADVCRTQSREARDQGRWFG